MIGRNTSKKNNPNVQYLWCKIQINSWTYSFVSYSSLSDHPPSFSPPSFSSSSPFPPSTSVSIPLPPPSVPSTPHSHHDFPLYAPYSIPSIPLLPGPLPQMSRRFVPRTIWHDLRCRTCVHCLGWWGKKKNICGPDAGLDGGQHYGMMQRLLWWCLCQRETHVVRHHIHHWWYSELHYGCEGLVLLPLPPAATLSSSDTTGKRISQSCNSINILQEPWGWIILFLLLEIIF